MALSVVKPGMLDTLQDMGRTGYGNWGINPGGAMDRYAAQVANMLVGNCCSEAVLEIHFPGPQLLFEQNALIAVTGADFTPHLDDEPIPISQPVVMRKNTVLHFPKNKNGARCYLACHGGFCLDKWLGSYSTNLKAAVGGWKGRALKKGDELSLKESTLYYPGWLKEDKNMRVLPWQADSRLTYNYPHEIFVTAGHEWELLKVGSRNNFLENNFTIHPSSDRMGYNLRSAPLELDQPHELVSSAVNFGTLQLLPDGQLIVLMADHQTTGGYPRIGHVISSHLPKLAQLQPSDCMQFKMIDVGRAEALYFKQHDDLQIVKRACLDHLKAMVC